MEGVVLTGEVDLVVDLPGDHLAKVAAGGVHVMKDVMEEAGLVADLRPRMMAVDLPGDHLAKVAAGGVHVMDKVGLVVDLQGGLLPKAAAGGVHVMKGVMGEAGMVADPRLRMMAVDLQGGLLPKGADGGVRIMKEAGLMGLLLLLTNL
jgi:hypothetical protein